MDLRYTKQLFVVFISEKFLPLVQTQFQNSFYDKEGHKQ